MSLAVPNRFVQSFLAAAVVALVAAACAAGSGPSLAAKPRAEGSSGGSATPRASLLPGSPTALPRFDPAGFRRLLSQLRGTPVVVNFWASWCGPCTAEAPDLARVARGFEGRVQFIGVDIQDQQGPARAFVRRYGWPYPSVFDASGAIRDDMGFLGQPVTVVFDRSGARAFAWSGAISSKLLTRELLKVV